jgi:hypothetical protein
MDLFDKPGLSAETTISGGKFLQKLKGRTSLFGLEERRDFVRAGLAIH